MSLSHRVIDAIDAMQANRYESALLNACIAVDGTAKRLYPSGTGSKRRFVQCLRRYYWILEPMIGAGFNLVETRFSNVQLRDTSSPDLAEVVYEVFRCNLAHGDDVPPAFTVIRSLGGLMTFWDLAAGEIHMPDTIVWALLAVTVFSKVNYRERVGSTYFLALGGDRFPLPEWWGREDDFRPFAERRNRTRVKFEKLERLKPCDGRDSKYYNVITLNPPFI